jgi:hypothetical protein
VLIYDGPSVPWQRVVDLKARVRVSLVGVYATVDGLVSRNMWIMYWQITKL